MTATVLRSRATVRRPLDARAPAEMWAAVQDLARIRPAVYWADLTASAVLGWGGVLLASRSWVRDGWWSPATWLLLAVAALALYRGASFIHEVSHFGNRRELATWVWAWRLLFGVPLMLPSLMYALHPAHHATVTYGTDDDGEYFAPTQTTGHQLLAAAGFTVLGVIGLALRFGVVAPLSWCSPAVARFKWRHLSSLAIREGYAAGDRPDGGFLRRRWALEEALTCAWIWGVVATVAVWPPARPPAACFVVAASLGLLVNGLRVVGAHRYRAPATGSRLAQYLDAVDYVSPSGIAALWAPVGLRYHAVHHLFPRLPYHALGEARARLAAGWDCDITAERSLVLVIARRLRPSAV